LSKKNLVDILHFSVNIFLTEWVEVVKEFQLWMNLF
jgi:hypothetical protein